MNNTIIIGFKNDNNTYELPKTIIKLYPNSILSLYEAAETNEKIIIEDMTYEQFEIVHSVITKKTKQWLVPPDILKFMDKYGLVDDALINLHDFINIKVNNKMTDLDNFINGEGLLLQTKYNLQYEKYKEIFKNNKNIMSLQITYYKGIILCINIFDSIPIFCFTDKADYLDNGASKPYQIENIPINNEMDVNLLRYHILLKNIKCDRCVQCDKCINSEEINIICCKPCRYCIGRWDGEEKYNKHMKYSGKAKIKDTIYTKNNWDYLMSVNYLIQNKFENDYVFKIVECDEPNIIFWDTITPLIFNNNITKSLTKIIDVIMEDGGDENTIYNEADDGNFKTCRGFLNITNALK